MLTQREKSTLILISQGYTIPEIAAARKTSTTTQATHVRALRRKLGARNKAHAVSRGFELGILQ